MIEEPPASADRHRKALSPESNHSAASTESNKGPIPTISQAVPIISPPVRQEIRDTSIDGKVPQRLYEEIRYLRQRTENLTNDWVQTTQHIDQDRAAPYKQGQPGPMPEQLPTVLAQRLADSDQQISSLYAELSSQISKTRPEAIAYMKLTPNQLAEDEANFRSANSKALRQTPVADLLRNTPDRDRYRPMAIYLDELRRQTGDYK